ncbi:uncharacterized protein LOC121804074 [Salvia splendens]|uniref:uncharacterized protein LOC121804074 n=1 Tax=Salvia splendens TaxID=180675 RepID=UPI001C26ED46|nr:uncharacterized protein LOC121804074 [Salvia splendens]
MPESDSGTEEKTPHSNTPVTLSADQFAELLRLSMSHKSEKPPKQYPPDEPQPESLGDIKLVAKLDGDNYPLWARMMGRAIGGKSLTSHITGVSDPPSPTDPIYPKWQQRDHCCFNWIINNIDPSLVNQVSQYEATKDLWEGLAITYESGADPFQVSDLHRQAYGMKQGGMTLEALCNKFQDLWLSIDSRDPNPMDTPSSIKNTTQSFKGTESTSFYGLSTIDVRTAYGIIRREAVNARIRSSKTETKDSEIGIGLSAVDRNRGFNQPKFQSNRKEEDKSKLTCTHCGGKKHTRDTCFLIHGYPEWWDEMKKARANRNSNRGGGGGRAAIAVGERATYTETPSAGSVATPIATGEDRSRNGDEKKAVASASVVRAWSEGYQDGDDS